MHYGGEELEMKLTGTPYQEKSEILAMDGLWRFSLIASEISARIPIQIASTQQNGKRFSPFEARAMCVD